MAFDAAGNAHVADYYAATIYVFAPDGTYLTQWGDPGSEPGQFGAAGSILIDEHGVAYVGEFGRVQAFQLLPLPDLASPEAGEATPSS